MRETWMGSGIFSDFKSFWVSCPECNADWQDDLFVDDWGHVDAELICYNCDHEFVFNYIKGEE